jgi:predicted double-glycine peptidase
MGEEGRFAMLLGLCWFLGLMGVAGLALGLGVWAGQGGRRRTMLATLAAMILLVAWAWLFHQPAVAVRVLPVWLLSRIEGVASVPAYMVVVGVVWARAQRRRERTLAAAALLVGVVFFLHGAGWMLQPATSFALDPSLSGGDDEEHAVLQSSDYSCVPAATATALGRIGVMTSEAQMAQLTFTVPGSGATLLRALAGINARLEGTGISATLLQSPVREIARLPMPLLTPLQLSATQLHMVVVEKVDRHGIWVSDPMSGRLLMDRDEFAKAYTGSVIAFQR